MESVDLKTKLKQLTIAVKRTSKTLESGKREPIKRHLETLQTVLKETNECKRAEELSDDEDIANIDEWNAEIEGELESADNEVLRLEEWLVERERKEKLVAQEDMVKLELDMHERKLKMQEELSKPKPETEESGAFSDKTAKLPKLAISKFDGSFVDWPRFWGQFTEAVDKSSIAPVSKLTYLLELLVPKVKRSVEALPFTAETLTRTIKRPEYAPTIFRRLKNGGRCCCYVQVIYSHKKQTFIFASVPYWGERTLYSHKKQTFIFASVPYYYV